MDISDRLKLARGLEKHEGKRLLPYTCSEGKLTIGVGHNLTDNGLHPEVISLQFRIDMDFAIADCVSIFPGWQEYPPRWQIVFADMAFNLGRNKLSRFVKMITAAEDGDLEEIIAQMRDSKWATQVKTRVDNLERTIRGND